jgi:hypothetical protein
MRMRIARTRRARESRYWVQLVDVGECAELELERGSLVDEADQLIRILSKILAGCAQRPFYGPLPLVAGGCSRKLDSSAMSFNRRDSSECR